MRCTNRPTFCFVLEKPFGWEYCWVVGKFAGQILGYFLTESLSRSWDFVVGTVADTWTLAKAILLAFGTVILAAELARRWQYRNWLSQQRITDQEKLNNDIKLLVDEFIALSSKRRFRSQRLYWALKSKKAERIELARKQYDDILHSWNDTYVSWQVRFVKSINTGSYLFSDIESRITLPFLSVGLLLERGIRRVEAASGEPTVLTMNECAEIEAKLNGVARAIFQIGRETYSKLDYLSADRLDQKSIVKSALSHGRFEELSLAELFKAVITSNVERRLW